MDLRVPMEDWIEHEFEPELLNRAFDRYGARHDVGYFAKAVAEKARNGQLENPNAYLMGTLRREDERSKGSDASASGPSRANQDRTGMEKQFFSQIAAVRDSVGLAFGRVIDRVLRNDPPRAWPALTPDAPATAENLYDWLARVVDVEIAALPEGDMDAKRALVDYRDAMKKKADPDIPF